MKRKPVWDTPPFCPFYCLTADYQAYKDKLSFDDELRRRGIRASYLQTSERWRLYKIPGDQVQKLPVWLAEEDRYHSEAIYYLGDDKSGHSIYPVHPETLKEDEDRARKGGFGGWRKV